MAFRPERTDLVLSPNHLAALSSISVTRSVRIVRHVRALRVEALVGVCAVVDDLQLSVPVEEAVAAADVPVLVPLLVAELTVVPARITVEERA